MTPIKKKGGRHADQPVESTAPEQRQATARQPSLPGRMDPPAVLGCSALRRRVRAVQISTRGCGSTVSPCPSLRFVPPLYTQVDVVAVAVVTGIGKKKKQRGRSDSDAPPKKKKEFLRLQHGRTTVFCAPCGSALAGALLAHSRSPAASRRRSREARTPTCSQGCLRALERGSQRPAQLLRAAFGLERTGQPSPLDLIAKRCRGGACPKESRQSRCLGNPGPPTPRHS